MFGICDPDYQQNYLGAFGMKEHGFESLRTRQILQELDLLHGLDGPGFHGTNPPDCGLGGLAMDDQVCRQHCPGAAKAAFTMHGNRPLRGALLGHETDEPIHLFPDRRLPVRHRQAKKLKWVRIFNLA